MSQPAFGKVRDFLNLIRDRLPGRNEIIAVFGVAVFVCHSWTILGFFNKLPSFILYFTVSEMLSIFAYMMSVALLESIAVTIILVFLSMILPQSWLREGFAYKGFVIVAIATAASILFQKFLPDDYPSTLMLAVSAVVPIVLMVVVIGISQAFPRLRSLLLDIQDRISIILYIYVPLGILSLMVVFIRNLL
jgi:hypothetical protein